MNKVFIVEYHNCHGDSCIIGIWKNKPTADQIINLPVEGHEAISLSKEVVDHMLEKGSSSWGWEHTVSIEEYEVL